MRAFLFGGYSILRLNPEMKFQIGKTAILIFLMVRNLLLPLWFRFATLMDVQLLFMFLWDSIECARQGLFRYSAYYG
jgi:hypothetical protein